MTKQSVGAIAIGIILSLGGTTARAEAPGGFGETGQVVVSVDRLFGYLHLQTTETQNGTDATTTADVVSALGNTVSLLSLYATPRLALDYFVTDRFTVGGSATLFHASASPASMPGVTTTTATLWGFSLAPRLGFALPLGSGVSFWPRVGFTWVQVSQSFSGDSQETHIYALTIEAPFLFRVGSNFFLTAAPTLDLGLGGSTSLTSRRRCPIRSGTTRRPTWVCSSAPAASSRSPSAGEGQEGDARARRPARRRPLRADDAHRAVSSPCHNCFLPEPPSSMSEASAGRATEESFTGSRDSRQLTAM